jgi:outer membrane receptor protein involved in Fe transport
VQQTSAGQGAVVLRGLVGNQVLLLVNGIPLNNGTYRDGPGQYLATIDPESIERIEVVRGPASVAYGSDAQGGVINVITRPHPAGVGMSLGGALQASTGNQGARARLSAGYGTATWQARAGLTLMGTGDLRAGDPVGAQQPTGFDAWGMDARLDYVPSGAHQITAGVQQFWMNGVPRYDRYWDYRAPALGPDYDYRLDQGPASSATSLRVPLRIADGPPADRDGEPGRTTRDTRAPALDGGHHPGDADRVLPRRRLHPGPEPGRRIPVRRGGNLAHPDLGNRGVSRPDEQQWRAPEPGGRLRHPHRARDRHGTHPERAVPGRPRGTRRRFLGRMPR